MDERDGGIFAIPCCFSWIKDSYGAIGSASLLELWNSEGAQRIRQLIAAGRQHEICSPHCAYWMSGRYGETALRIVEGSQEFVENQKVNLAEIQRRQPVLRSKPMLLKVLPTLRCNLRCTMCYQCNYDTNGLGEGIWREIAQLLPYTHEIAFQGGEATLDKGFRNFFDSVELQSHRHVKISLITNGTVLDKRLLEGLRHVKLNYIIVSLNAATRETYARITGKDFFERVVGNLRQLSELAHNHSHGDFILHASFVVMRSNFHELPQFLEIASSLGIEVQLLNVIGNRNNEDIFVRTDQHETLRRVLDQASHISTGTAKEQVDRIRIILDSHRPPIAANGGEERRMKI
ncbi:MAG: radical SAM protein [Phycisphaerales bacterium]|nr:radical SAM protein [Phycisphaerales bacterium]